MQETRVWNAALTSISVIQKWSKTQLVVQILFLLKLCLGFRENVCVLKVKLVFGEGGGVWSIVGSWLANINIGLEVVELEQRSTLVIASRSVVRIKVYYYSEGWLLNINFQNHSLISFWSGFFFQPFREFFNRIQMSPCSRNVRWGGGVSQIFVSFEGPKFYSLMIQSRIMS